jgi:hypothetical protein
MDVGLSAEVVSGLVLVAVVPKRDDAGFCC